MYLYFRENNDETKSELKPGSSECDSHSKSEFEVIEG